MVVGYGNFLTGEWTSEFAVNSLPLDLAFDTCFYRTNELLWAFRMLSSVLCQDRTLRHDRQRSSRSPVRHPRHQVSTMLKGQLLKRGIKGNEGGWRARFHCWATERPGGIQGTQSG